MDKLVQLELPFDDKGYRVVYGFHFKKDNTGTEWETAGGVEILIMSKGCEFPDDVNPMLVCDEEQYERTKDTIANLGGMGRVVMPEAEWVDFDKSIYEQCEQQQEK